MRRFTCELNELEDGVAPTDSRLRPDQRLMEEGKWDEANTEKVLTITEMWWLIGSAPDFWGREVPGSNPAFPTMILKRCRIIVK